MFALYDPNYPRVRSPLIKELARAQTCPAITFVLYCTHSISCAESITNRPPDQIGPNSRVWFGKASLAATADASLEPLAVATAITVPNAPTLDQDAVTTAAEAPRTSRVEEIATGMNYWDGEGWTPSQASFDVAADGFVATRLQYLVKINAQINSLNAINIVTRDGITIRSTPDAVALYDRASGASLIIGAITNSTGVLVSSNKVVFENAFHGISADLVYTIEKGTFEQDAVLRTRLDPAEYNFPRKTSCIQVLTEVYEAPAPDRIRRPLYVEERENVRQQMASPDVEDKVVVLGNFVPATGRAFNSEFDGAATNAAASVSKEFRTIDGRRFLIERSEEHT